MEGTMTASKVRRAVAILALVAAAPARLALAADALSPEQQAQFLLTAKVVSHKGLSKGVTHPVRVTLTDGTLTHDAAFSTIDERESIMKFKDGRTELNFVDSYKYSVAAYRVAQLIGLDEMMPVTVEREIDHQKGALSWWVDDVKFDEGERLKTKAQPPDPAAWNHQMYNMRLFTQLVGDTDRNTGNVLITNDWKVWMIDFTRAFRHTHKLITPRDVTRCDRQLLDRMKKLTRDEVAEATHSFLGGSEVDALLARRDALVSLIDQMVAERGEAQVLF
jgi:hypothetical protein